MMNEDVVSSKQESIIPMDLDVEEGHQPIPVAATTEGIMDNESSYYNPAIRFLMAMGGIPLAFFALMLLMISPIMFTYMHDDPKTYEFPGNLWAIVAFIIYMCAVAIIGIYSWALLSSAIQGATTLRLGGWGNRRDGHNPTPRIDHRWTSPTCGIILLIPAIFILTAYLISNVG